MELPLRRTALGSSEKRRSALRERYRAAIRWMPGVMAASLCACAEKDADAPWRGALGEVRTLRYVATTSPRALPPVFEDVLTVSVPLGVAPGLLAVAATDALVLGDGSRAVEPITTSQDRHFASVSSLGSLVVGQGVRLGSVYALGRTAPELGGGTLVAGYVKSVAVPRVSTRTIVTLGLISNLEPYVDEFRWHIRFPVVDSGDRGTSEGVYAALRLPPGRYNDISIAPNSTFVVGSGEYFFESIELREGGKLQIENMAGPVYLWVRRSLALMGVMEQRGPRSNVIMGYLGRAAPLIACNFVGTLVAPYAEVHLPRTVAPHRGAFFARTVDVADGAAVEHQAFAPVAP